MNKSPTVSTNSTSPHCKAPKGHLGLHWLKGYLPPIETFIHQFEMLFFLTCKQRIMNVTAHNRVISVCLMGIRVYVSLPILKYSNNTMENKALLNGSTLRNRGFFHIMYSLPAISYPKEH